MKNCLLFFFLLSSHFIFSQNNVSIQVDALQGKRPISPYIYGRNNNVSDAPGNPTSAGSWKLMREAGLRFARENGGNNCSKYNWRLKISSHPDWYNNIYPHNWDFAAKSLQDSLPGAQGMWAFQLLGKAAKTTTQNFDDWGYNQSQWWAGTCQNLAGGGVANGGGGCVAQTPGNTNLYLEDWNSDSTVSLLDHWFGAGGIGLDKNKIVYWSMDNEVDIWNSTHDDVMPTQLSAEAFMQLYFTVAKKARAKFPNIKLVGPVPASEWQWYSWNNNKITVGGQSYVWLEFFIKRIAEEEAASGIRLLDVIDIHNYPNESNNADIVQLHRIYYDTTYNYPGANGVKTTSPSGWDNSITKEYVFGRCEKWLTQYMGANHGVTFSVSELGFNGSNANVSSVCYGSMLGTFADHGCELFAPWYWNTGMWETLHLYSRYGKTTRVKSVSSQENSVSAYSSINTAGDSMTVILVNRDLSATKTTTVSIANFNAPNGNYVTERLSQLPSTETFVSHTNNALVAGTVSVTGNSFTLSLPPLSTTAVILKGQAVTSVDLIDNLLQFSLFPNPVSENAFISLGPEQISDLQIELYNAVGERIYLKNYSGVNRTLIEIPAKDLSKGVYVIHISVPNGKGWTSKLVKL